MTDPRHFSKATKTSLLDIPIIAKMKRIADSYIGIRKIASRPFPAGRNSGFKRTMRGEIVARGSFAVWGGTGREEGVICERDDSDYSPAESHANARLIASAPDLLAALRGYLDARPQCECTPHSGCQMAKARIAKAEGPTP